MFRVRSGHVAATLDMINSCTPAAISSPRDHYLRRKCCFTMCVCVCVSSLFLWYIKSNTLIDFKQCGANKPYRTKKKFHQPPSTIIEEVNQRIGAPVWTGNNLVWRWQKGKSIQAKLGNKKYYLNTDKISKKNRYKSRKQLSCSCFWNPALRGRISA